MRYVFRLSVVCLSVGLGACVEQSLPQLGEPFPLSVPAGRDAVSPRLAQSPDGLVALSWIERAEESGGSLHFSTLAEGKWRPANTVISDKRMFVNWADLPGVWPLGGNSAVAHWLSYVGDSPYAYGILTRSTQDLGKTWSEIQPPHLDGTATEHGFVSVYTTSSSTGLVWLDGRNMAAGVNEETADGGMTLRSAEIAADQSFVNGDEIDSLVCDCCQTDVAVTDSGPVVVYRDRSAGNIRDIYVARQIDGHWQDGVAVSSDNWVIEACPVNGPAIDANGDLLAVTWFTGADGKAVVKSAFSKNGGASFSSPVEIASRNALGYVGIAFVDEQSYVVSWIESDRKGTYSIRVRSLTLDGQFGPPRTVGRSSVSSTVPQLTRSGDQLLVAWSDKIGDNSKVVSVRVPILGFYDR